MKPCTEAPSNIQHARVKTRINFRKKKLNVSKLLNAKPMPEREEKIVFKVPLNIDVVTELYGMIKMDVLYLVL